MKNAYLTQERTFSRKFKEIFIAVKLGNSKPKDEILADYLNTIYFGRNAYGIQAAVAGLLRQARGAARRGAGRGAGRGDPHTVLLRPGRSTTPRPRRGGTTSSTAW